jgi:hypothetical protein
LHKKETTTPPADDAPTCALCHKAADHEVYVSHGQTYRACNWRCAQRFARTFQPRLR